MMFHDIALDSHIAGFLHDQITIGIFRYIPKYVHHSAMISLYVEIIMEYVASLSHGSFPLNLGIWLCLKIGNPYIHWLMIMFPIQCLFGRYNQFPDRTKGSFYLTPRTANIFKHIYIYMKKNT